MKYSALAALLAISLSSLVCVTALDCYEVEFMFASKYKELERRIMDDEYDLMVTKDDRNSLKNLLESIRNMKETLSSQEANSFLGEGKVENLSFTIKNFLRVSDVEFWEAVSKVGIEIDKFNMAQTLEEKLDALILLQHESMVLLGMVDAYIKKY
jgi:hypothetical protein